jgi:hypothetical protein
MSAIRFRMAEESDNDRILDLAKRCPQEGMITFFPNRTPRFNTLHRLLDPGTWHYVACNDDDIIGLVGVIHFHARVLNREMKVAYMLDLRVDKLYRSGLTAFRLVKTAIDHLRQSDVDMVVVNFLKDNKRPLVFTSGRGGLPPAYFLGENRIFNIIPLRFMKLNERFEISEMEQNDIPEVVALYQKYAAGFKYAPIMTEDLLNSYITSLEGLTPGSFLLARENGAIKAVTAMWDEHTYKSYQVLKLNTSTRMITTFLKFLSLFMPVPHPIRLNEPLRQLSLVLYAHDNCPEALDALFRHTNNINLGSGYTVITLYAQVNDPVFVPMKKFLGINVKSEMYIFARDTSIFEKLDADPGIVLMDLTMTL